MIYGTKEPCKCELFYSSGGHGGPYPNTFEAAAQAKALMIGRPAESYIEVRDADFKTVLLTIRRDDLIPDLMTKHPTKHLTPEQSAALIYAQASMMNGYVQAMIADNQICLQAGRPIEHSGDDFRTVVGNYRHILDLSNAAEIMRNGQIPN